MGPSGTIFREISIWKPYILNQENAFENFVCKMVVILSRPQCVKFTIMGDKNLSYLISIMAANALALLGTRASSDEYGPSCVEYSFACIERL